MYCDIKHILNPKESTKKLSKITIQHPLIQFHIFLKLSNRIKLMPFTTLLAIVHLYYTLTIFTL